MITVKDIAGLAAHLDTKDPHALEKADVGLNNVLNYRVASSTEAKAGTSNTLYMTPLRSKELIDSLTAKITKSSLGLSNVVNYGIATQAEAEAGSVNTEYMTPLRVKQAIAKLHGGLSNPHGITKSTVGLGSVSNYSVASTTEATSGSSNSRYMTPLRVKQAIEAMASSGGSWEIDAVDNGLFGYARHVESGFCIQWGQTPSMEENKAVMCYYRRPFTTRPFAITKADLGWTGDTYPDNPDEIAEIKSSIIAKSITESRFVMASSKMKGSNTDGLVMSWIAIGLSAGGVTLVSENSRCVFQSSVSGYGNGQPTRGAGHIVAPTSSSGGGSGGSAPGGGCIVYDVAMPLHDGTIKLAEDIVVGDRLPTRHFKDMPMGENKEWLNWSTEVGTDTTPEVVTVTAVRESTYHEYFIVNRTLKITRQHEILVGKEGVWQWLDVRDIEVGDYLLDAQGNAKVVESIAQVDETISVFDFDVEEIDTYIAGGYLVHNAEQIQK